MGDVSHREQVLALRAAGWRSRRWQGELRWGDPLDSTREAVRTEEAYAIHMLREVGRG